MQKWTDRGLIPGPSECKSGVIPLHHPPVRLFDLPQVITCFEQGSTRLLPTLDTASIPPATCRARSVKSHLGLLHPYLTTDYTFPHTPPERHAGAVYQSTKRAARRRRATPRLVCEPFQPSSSRHRHLKTPTHTRPGVSAWRRRRPSLTPASPHLL